MRLARTKEPRNPDTHSSGNFRVVLTINTLEKSIDEMTKVSVDLFGNHIFFELIIRPVTLVGFNHAIDRSRDIFRKNVLDFHWISPPI